MKINIFPAVIALIIAGLLAYLFYAISKDDDTALATTIAGFITTGTVLEGMMGIKLSDLKHTTNLRLLSNLFFVVALVFNLIAALVGMSLPFIIIFGGLIWVFYLLAAYSIAKIKM